MGIIHATLAARLAKCYVAQGESVIHLSWPKEAATEAAA